MPFTPGARTPCVFSPRAIVYLTGKSSGATNLPRQFKRLGALIACDPSGTNSITAYMLAPAGPLSAGNPPRAQLNIMGSDGVTPGTNADVLLIQI